MAKRRKKAKNRREQKDAEQSKRFLLTLVGAGIFFLICFIVLQIMYG